jgi:hypothetical protein
MWREIGLVEILVLEHRDKHRGHAVEAGDLLRLMHSSESRGEKAGMGTS